MIDLSTYKLEKLWEEGDLVISRGSLGGARPVLLSTPTSPQPTPAAMARLQRAWALREAFEPAWAARPRELAESRGKPTLVSEDPGGELLARALGVPWSLAALLRVGVGLAAALRQLHARGYVHKDLKPSNVLADPATGAVWLTGFGIASHLPRERQPPEPPEIIAGTLAYMAPEQTGRMNRSIDSRSDLYALGVVLYELLTGALPFSATDPMEWVHCHIARQPAPLRSHGRAPPQPLCELVLKLLAKNPEDRYQTAAGVERDLRRALAEWEATGAIAPFVPGASDRSERLLIPERLYGRDAEIAGLLASFGRVVETGGAQLVLVSGYPGIGKSSVVSELHRALVPPRGLYASGKFDQYKRDIPYATLAQAFQALLQQLLCRSEAEIETWRGRLGRALGANGALIASLAPELELIAGPQPAVPDLPPQEAQGRFQAVVRRFLSVFAQAEHPLVLFLDDLQWVDVATLELVEHLLSHAETRHLLVVGAYRDNEVGPAHPLTQTIERLRGAGTVREIVLAPLRSEDLAALCADALQATTAAALPLAELIHAKTGGNPFFAIQFLSALADERLLVLDEASGAWRWDLPAIQAKGFTDNVLDLMANRLHRLPDRTKQTLRQLACLGHSARPQVLSEVYGVSEAELADALREALVAGLVTSTSSGYAFVHDRVHEAAYALLPEADRPAEHLRIGRLLASHATPAQQDTIFEIVNHLDRGAALIETQAERDQVATLNLQAGLRARASTAAAATRTYLLVGRSLLGPDSWDRNFRLTFELELQLAEAEFLTSELPSAEERLDRLRERARSLPDRAAVLSLQTTLYTAMAGRTDRAIQLCLEYLRHVGIEWPAHPSEGEVRAEYERLLARISGVSIDDLANRPLLSNPDVGATIEVLMGMMTPAFNSDRGLVSLILCRMANLGLEHGTCDALSLGYAFLGMVLGCSFGDYRSGRLFGQLAVELCEERGLTRYRGRIHHTLGTHVLYWTEPIAVAQASLRRGLQFMQDAGDVTYVAFGYCGLATMLLGGGEALERLQTEVEAGLAVGRSVKFEMAIDLFLGHLRLIRALRGLDPQPCSLDDGGRPFVGDLSRCWYWIRVMQACFIFGDHAAALTALHRAEPLIAAVVGFFELSEFHFYAALTRAACHDALPVEERAALQGHRRALAIWAEQCPANHANRLALVDAELARLEGQPLAAMDAYERAIRSSKESGFVHNEAIAHEVAARFYAARGFGAIAQAYLQNARLGYLRWGAAGKVRQLDEELGPTGAPQPRRPSLAIETPSVNLDLETVVRSSQAVSTEIGLDRLIESLMVIALEHAGAQRGLLILPAQGQLRIEAEATTGTGKGVSVRRRQLPARHPELPETILHYVGRTRQTVLLADAQAPHAFSSDPYLREQRSRSIALIPLVKQAELVGLLYLENALAPDVFTNARIDVLELLASQAATSLESASLEQENATLAEKEALLKEVHHRVKNNLQLISSLLNLQAARFKDPALAEAFADSRNRVRAMALVHENLYRAGDFSKIPMANHLRSLCAQLVRAYARPEQRLELSVSASELHLDMNRAVTCGLIVNELVSNALKHAFPAGRSGRVRVELEPAGEARHALRVHDDGVGLPAGFEAGTADSLGLQLVRDLSGQLHGTLTVTREQGTTFTITFPEAALTASSGPR